jgi:hypothetical protein
MTSTKPSEPSDEGKAIGFTDERGNSWDVDVALWEDDVCQEARRATPADLLAAGFVPLSQLTEARAELERLRAELGNLIHAWDRLSGDMSTSPELHVMAKGESYARVVNTLRAVLATPPSPPAAVEAKPAEPNNQKSPTRDYCASCDTRSSSGGARCEDCGRVLIAQPAVDALCACGHRYGTHTRGVNGPCEICACSHWKKPAEGSEVERPRATCGECSATDGQCGSLGCLTAAERAEAPAQEQHASPNIVDTVNGYLKRAALEPHEPALDYVIDAVLELAAAVQERRQ